MGLSIATLLSQHHQVTAVDIVPEKVELMFTAYFLKNVKGFALTGKKCRCGDNGEIQIYPKEYFEGYSMCFKNNYSIHHCFGSWRYFENENEEHEESTLRNYLKSIYFLRWAKRHTKMKTTLLIMAAGIGSRFGTGIKQLEPVDDANHIIMDYSIHPM